MINKKSRTKNLKKTKNNIKTKKQRGGAGSGTNAKFKAFRNQVSSIVRSPGIRSAAMRQQLGLEANAASKPKVRPSMEYFWRGAQTGIPRNSGKPRKARLPISAVYIKPP